MGATFEVTFLETIVRDSKNQNPGRLLITSNDLENYVHTEITVRQTLDLVDLRGGNAIAMGIPTDAVRARSHRQGRRTSLALYTHPDGPEGIYHPSRLNQDQNTAVYDRVTSSAPSRHAG